MSMPTGFARSILLGAAFGAIFSLIPIINFLNLILMFWTAVGAGISVSLLMRQNPELSAGEAAAFGALSSLAGASIFALVTGFFILTTPIDNIEKAIGIVDRLLSLGGDTMFQDLSGARFRSLSLMFLALALICSLISGSMSGLFARYLARRRERDKKENNHGT